MAGNTQTIVYDALLTTTLNNYHKTLEDQISKSNSFIYKMMKGSGYKLVSDIGDRVQVPLMYAMQPSRVYAGYDVLDTTPIDGIKPAFYNWAQMSSSISISGIEQEKNKGEARIIDLLESKIKQTELGIKQDLNQRVLQGNGVNVAAQITTAFTDPVTGRLFVEPLPLQVKFTPNTTVVGTIDPAVDTWWRNQTLTDTSTTFAGFLKNLDHLYNDCSKGPGGSPNLHLTDQNSYELYVAALRSQNRFVEYAKADIPFRNVAFHQEPVTWDEFIPDVSGATTVQTATSGSWYMLNMDFWEMRVARNRNFKNSEFKQPINQDALVAFVLWLGSIVMTNRRKHGVMGSIDSTIVA